MREALVASDDVGKEGDLVEEARYVELAVPIARLLTATAPYRRMYASSRVWCISSTENGGGVAEMMPRMLHMMRGFGATARWLILEAGEMADPFFRLTKLLHNSIHGQGPAINDPDFAPDWLDAGLERLPAEVRAKLPPGAGTLDKMAAIYQHVNDVNAEAFLSKFLNSVDAQRDIVIIHDPQPMGMIRMLRVRCPRVKTIWRCHIGLDWSNGPTEAAWGFLDPHLRMFDACVFSTQEYVRESVKDRSVVIRPGIAPLTAKNRELSAFSIAQTLARAGLLPELECLMGECMVEPPFEQQALVYGKGVARADAGTADDKGEAGAGAGAPGEPARAGEGEERGGEDVAAFTGLEDAEELGAGAGFGQLQQLGRRLHIAARRSASPVESEPEAGEFSESPGSPVTESESRSATSITTPSSTRSAISPVPAGIHLNADGSQGGLTPGHPLHVPALGGRRPSSAELRAARARAGLLDRDGGLDAASGPGGVGARHGRASAEAPASGRSPRLASRAPTKPAPGAPAEPAEQLTDILAATAGKLHERSRSRSAPRSGSRTAPGREGAETSHAGAAAGTGAAGASEGKGGDGLGGAEADLRALSAHPSVTVAERGECIGGSIMGVDSIGFLQRPVVLQVSEPARTLLLARGMGWVVVLSANRPTFEQTSLGGAGVCCSSCAAPRNLVGRITTPCISSPSPPSLRRLQVSRWDRLKGWFSLLKAWVDLKTRISYYCQECDLLLTRPSEMPCARRHRRILESACLVCAGPDPKSIAGEGRRWLPGDRFTSARVCVSPAALMQAPHPRGVINMGRLET